jgi:hypothetical protein
MLTLGQLLVDSPVPMLPEAGVFERFVLESPWLLVGVVVFLALAAFLAFNKAGKLRQGVISLVAGLVVAGLAAVLGMAITTERERLQMRTRDLVRLTADANTSELKDYLDPHVKFSGISEVGSLHERDVLLESVRRYLGEMFKVRSHSLSRVGATIDGENVARTQVRVWVHVDKDAAMYDAPIGSWWRIDWRRDPVAGAAPGRADYGPWRVSRVSLMQLDGLGVAPEFSK